MENKCKLKRLGRNLVLTMPDGEVIPCQLDMFIEDSVDCEAVATISVIVDVSEIKEDENYHKNKREVQLLKDKINELDKMLKEKKSFSNMFKFYRKKL